MTTLRLDLPVGEHEGDRIRRMVDVLRWDESAPEALDTHRNYILLLSERLGANLGAASDHPAAARAHAAMSELPDSSCVQLLTAPRGSYALLWPSRHSAETTVALIATFAEVELARARDAGKTEASLPESFPGPEVQWSALGDGWIASDGAFIRGPALDRFPPLDLASPHALKIDLEGVKDETASVRQPLPLPALRASLDMLAETRDRIEATCPAAMHFVNAFTKVLVLQEDFEAPTMFSTGSSAQYVGRSVFGNPHLGKVDHALLAEGLVHEAIHSLLYMGERLEPWVRNETLYGPEPRARSLWTGNPLPLRSYLQACFVWYGLAQFWSRAMGAKTFPSDRVRNRLEQSVSGFLGEDLLAQIAPFRQGIGREVCDAIEEMQSDITEALGVGV